MPECRKAHLGRLSEFSVPLLLNAHFHVSVYFACLDLDQPDRFHWVALRDLIGRVPERRGRTRVVALPTAEAFEVDFAVPFLDAYMRFSEHSLAV